MHFLGSGAIKPSIYPSLILLSKNLREKLKEEQSEDSRGMKQWELRQGTSSLVYHSKGLLGKRQRHTEKINFHKPLSYVTQKHHKNEVSFSGEDGIIQKLASCKWTIQKLASCNPVVGHSKHIHEYSLTL